MEDVLINYSDNMEEEVNILKRIGVNYNNSFKSIL